MSEAEKLAAIREWFNENVWSSWADWEAFAELGAILKGEDSTDEEPIEWGPPERAVHYNHKLARVPDQVPFEPGHKLDPMPFVLLQDGVEERISYSDPNKVYARFVPRPSYEQDRVKYTRALVRKVLL